MEIEKMDMPVVSLEVLKSALSDKEFALAQECVATRKGATRLRASKPKDPIAAYIWRMAAFMVSPKGAHNCIPMTADMDLEENHFSHRTETYEPKLVTDFDRETVAKWDEKTWNMMNRGAKKRAFIKDELDPIVSKIVDAVSKKEWHGVRRWGYALGAI